MSLTGGSFLSGSITGGAVMHGSTGNAYANTVTIEDSSVKGWVADGGVYDSLVRERIFEKLAEIIGTDYDYIYDQWVKSAKVA